MKRTMKNEWFFESQRLFKKWKNENNKSSDCIHQLITSDRYEEKMFLYPKDGGLQEVFTLHSYRHTDEVFLLPEVGRPERIYLRKAKPLI